MEAWTLLCRTSEEKTSWLTDLVTIQTKRLDLAFFLLQFFAKEPLLVVLLVE